MTILQVPANTSVSAAPGTTVINDSGKAVDVNGESVADGATLKVVVTTPPSIPQTGDESNLVLWLALMAVSAAAVVAVGKKVRFN